MDARSKGAWLLAHSKSLDLVSGPGSARLEKVGYAGKIGRLCNILRRGSDEARATEISAQTVETLCQLNNIELASRKDGLNTLAGLGRIDVSSTGAVAVLGATSAAVLETTNDVFEGSNPSRDEHAVLSLSDDVASRPVSRDQAEEKVSDEFGLTSKAAADLVELCKRTALIDEELGAGEPILFNSNTFRDKSRAVKAYSILQHLRPDEAARLSEVEELLRTSGDDRQRG